MRGQDPARRYHLPLRTPVHRPDHGRRRHARRTRLRPPTSKRRCVRLVPLLRQTLTGLRPGDRDPVPHRVLQNARRARPARQRPAERFHFVGRCRVQILAAVVPPQPRPGAGLSSLVRGRPARAAAARHRREGGRPSALGRGCEAHGAALQGLREHDPRRRWPLAVLRVRARSGLGVIADV
jgi:hypothetical protein